MSEAFVGAMAKDWRSLSCQAGAPRAVWAITFINEVKNRTKRKIDGTEVEPLLLELRENGETVKKIFRSRIVLSSGLRGDVKRLRYYHRRVETTNSRQSRSWVSFLAATKLS